MSFSSKESLRIISTEVVERISGIKIKDAEEFAKARANLSPDYLTEQRLLTQASEIFLITKDADQIEDFLRFRRLPIPSAYALFTSGYEVPKDSIFLGKYGKYPFNGFTSPAILGHQGEVHLVKENKKSIMVLKGRAHPNEWNNEQYGNLAVAHPLRVIQELIRRQRAETGENPPVVLTYVCGVVQDYPLKRGDLGIIIDETDGINIPHPGHGPVELLSQYIGPHFQPKMERASDKTLAKEIYTLAKERKIPIFPATIYGTPGTTEYQGWLEVGQALSMFKEAKKAGLSDYAKEIFGKDGKKISPLLGMGNSFELATLRQTFPKEQDIRKIAIALATDVGGRESTIINHDDVVETAKKTGQRNSELILDFLRNLINKKELVVDRTDYSIKNKLTDF